MIFLIEKIHCTVAITTMYFTAEWSIESLKTPPYSQRLTIDLDDFTSLYLMNTWKMKKLYFKRTSQP
jgi:hypothetical protein